MISLAAYILLIAGVNWAFSVLPVLPLPNGEVWAPISLIVGFVFVVRDVAQRRVGHHVLWGMLAGCALSWKMASPELALASAAAFAVSELSDWMIYTITRKPFSSRILFSSFVSAPLDTIVFLWLTGLAAPLSFLAMTASKIAGALLVFWLLRRRENCSSPLEQGA
ncbi:MAG: VUT family protein [Desulfovibrio sp.]|jgi:uncharacterized PurR-regulated membrane protein YhhQ (DUF165 family)|nr:VUT family protein [Desulfovibrio sp.]